jgi:hypothetical protein
MRLHQTQVILLFFAIAAALSGQLCAQEPSCAQVHAMAQMARARSMSELNPLKRAAGDSYRARLVFAFRALDLRPAERTASAVLDFLPQDDSHRGEWSSLSGWICEEEQERDVKSLALLQTRIPRDFAKSVILFPKRMYQYISYPVIVGLGPDDDYAEEMVAVCRTHPREFRAAIGQLPKKDRDWFLKVIFEPSDCRALAHPEGD